ncbi:lysophospholipid acyltransferase family protein [candidate division KSB1 bacterium]|nr:lysophospholipid acyltransferase family protein [candidate division KSB1 bacterium]
MIEARSSKWADALFWFYLHRLLQRHFYAVWLIQTELDLHDDLPVVLLPNHHTWWDGFFVYLLNRAVIQRPLYLMMLEEQLRKNPFFARVGAYSIDPHTPGGIRRSIDYTLSLLEFNPLICLFPQGELTPSVQSEIQYRPGIGALTRRSDKPLQVVQLALRTLFLEQQRPEIFMLMGAPIQVESGQQPDLVQLQQKHRELLDGLDRSIAENEPKRLLLQGRRSINDRHRRRMAEEGIA